MPGIFDPHRDWSAKPHPYSLHWNAVDLIDVQSGRGFGIPIDTYSISEIGANGVSSMTFTYGDAKRVLSLPALGRVQFNDHNANEVLFAGFVMGRRTYPWKGVGYAIDVTATDYSYLLDTTRVPALRIKAGLTDRHLIQAVVGHAMRHPHIYTHTSLVTSTNSNMPAMEFSHLTLRSAIENIQAVSGADRHYYVDFLGRLHYFVGPTEAGMGSAPFVITNAPSGAQRATESLIVEYDDSQIVNAVYIYGGSAAGSGWEHDEASVKLYGLRQGSFDAPHSKTAGARASVGLHFLRLHKDPIVRGQFDTTGSDVGWRVGQTVTVTNTQLGISSATYPIVQIDTVFLSGTGIRKRTIYFGDLPASGRRRPRNKPAAGATSTGPGGASAPAPASRLGGYQGGAYDKVRL